MILQELPTPSPLRIGVDRQRLIQSVRQSLELLAARLERDAEPLGQLARVSLAESVKGLGHEGSPIALGPTATGACSGP